ncbi:MAG TPA: hypothetical protein VFY35_13320 [Burkholderiaceae bacterium]|nr:hypothetical protein [Burkholderiaceae bacterium]
MSSVFPTQPASSLPSSHEREVAFEAARRTLAASPCAHLATKPHRAIRHVVARPGLLLHMVALPALLIAGLYSAHTALFGFWRSYVLWWAERMDLPLRVASAMERSDQMGLVWQADAPGVGLSVDQGLWLGLAITVLAWIGTLFMRGAWLPIKYLIRTGCVVQTLSLVYFAWVPIPFPHGVLGHVVNVLEVGYTLMLAIPVLLGLGYYALNLGLGTKLWHTVLIWAYFAVMVPQQALVHLVVLQHLSVVFMPTLYLCFGALFDMMVFVALYAWAASKAPLSATT